MKNANVAEGANTASRRRPGEGIAAINSNNRVGRTRSQWIKSKTEKVKSTNVDLHKRALGPITFFNAVISVSLPGRRMTTALIIDSIDVRTGVR